MAAMWEETEKLKVHHFQGGNEEADVGIMTEVCKIMRLLDDVKADQIPPTL